MRTRTLVASLGALAVLVSLAACSGSDSDASPSVGSSPERSSSTSTAPSAPVDTRPASSVTNDDTAGSDSVVTVPDGVPGLDSDDRFCRAWSVFAGSFQALAFASDLATDPSTATRVELAAAAAVNDAWLTMDSAFPADIDPAEQRTFLDGVLGPFANRANGAEQSLIDAGLTTEQTDELGALWLATLTATGLGDADLDIAVPAEMQPAFDTTQAAFEAANPPIVADERLATTARAPETFAHIEEHCPDQGILAGVDAPG